MTTPINLQTLITFLTAICACEPSLVWIRSLPPNTSPERAWGLCPRADWLVWLMAKIEMDPRRIVFAACVCAEQALRVLPDGETRPGRALEAARLWCASEASDGTVGAALFGAREVFVEAPVGSPLEDASAAVTFAVEPVCTGWTPPASRAPLSAAGALAGYRVECVDVELARMADLVRMHVPWSAVEARLAEVLS